MKLKIFLLFVVGIEVGFLIVLASLNFLPQGKVATINKDAVISAGTKEPEPAGQSSLGDAKPQPVVAQELEKGKLTFAFGGDVMLGRYIGYSFKNNFPALVSNLSPNPFENKDIAWLNLEGPLSDQTVVQPIQANNLIFNFSKESVEALKSLKVNIVGLGNNHAHNKGESGLATTRSMLETNGISWHGSPYKVSQESVKRVEKNGHKISLIAIHALIDTPEAETIIKTEAQAGYFVIVLPHWGVEYQSQHSAKQEVLAKLWIDTGADMIVGMHPHVVQDAEMYKDKIIFYSLGNLIFDQTFSKGTQQGLLVTGEITDKLRITLMPVESKNLKPQLAGESAKAEVLKTVCGSATFCTGDTIDLVI